MQKRLLFVIAVIALAGAEQVVPGQTALAATSTAAAASMKGWVNPIKDEHLKGQGTIDFQDGWH